MNLKSDNGWQGIPNKDETFSGSLVDPDLTIFTASHEVSDLFLFFIRQFHETVEPIDGPIVDDWSWAWRPVRGTTNVLSCHASGTAVDINALKHPRGSFNTFTHAQVNKLREILASFRDPHTGLSIFKWGGDFHGVVDEMHFQIQGDQAAVARVHAIKETELPSVEDIWGTDQIPYTTSSYGVPYDPKHPNRSASFILSQIDRIIRVMNDRDLKQEATLAAILAALEKK